MKDLKCGPVSCKILRVSGTTRLVNGKYRKTKNKRLWKKRVGRGQILIQRNKKKRFVLKLKHRNKKGWKIFDIGNHRLKNTTRL